MRVIGKHLQMQCTSCKFHCYEYELEISSKQVKQNAMNKNSKVQHKWNKRS